MKALRKTNVGFDNMIYETLLEPALRADEVRVKVLFSGICGTDIHNFKGDYTKVTPITLGHEFSGEVLEIGKKVTTLKIGDLISSETTFEVCERCFHCQNQEYNLCSQRKGIGTQVDGSFAEQIIVKAIRCHKIPNNVTPQAAALLEPLACCVHAVMEKTVVHPKQTIAVFGPGPIGLITSLILKTYDVSVILIGVNNDCRRLKLATSLGIDVVLNSQTTDLKTEILKLTNNNGVDQVFECSGNELALREAFVVSKKKGTVVQVGLFVNNIVSVDTSLLIHKEIKWIGSRTQKPSSWKLALALLKNMKIDLNPLISSIYPLEEWRSAFEAVISGKEIKVLLQP